MAAPQSLAGRVSCFLQPATAGEAQPVSARELKAYYAALLAVFFVLLVPIWIVKYPGMVDYPNHLTRCYILAHYHDNPVFQQRYILDRSPLPNLAIDLIVTPLLRFLPLLVAGKVFLSLAAALYVGGCSAVGRAVTGKPDWLALVCAFTFYNSQLLFGFVNFVFGAGIFLCVFAFWLRIRNAMTPLRFLFCCLLSIAAFLAHLSSVVILGVACCTVALLDFLRDRKARGLIVKLAWLACPLLFMEAFVKKNSGQIGTIAWGLPSEKLIALLTPVRTYSMAMDVGLISVLLLCAWAMLKGSKVYSAAVAGLVLFTLFLITPKVLFGMYPADARYVIYAYVLLILSIEPRWGRWQKAALAVALTAMVIRTGSIAANWRTISRRSEQVLAMGQDLPEGARIYVWRLPLGASPKLDRGFGHVIQLWAVSHDADVSTLFASRGQQPLLFRQPPCSDPELAKCFAGYDYIWTYDPPAALRQAVLPDATPVATWEKVTLWRVNRASASSVDNPGKTNPNF